MSGPIPERTEGIRKRGELCVGVYAELEVEADGNVAEKERSCIR